MSKRDERRVFFCRVAFKSSSHEKMNGEEKVNAPVTAVVLICGGAEAMRCLFLSFFGVLLVACPARAGPGGMPDFADDSFVRIEANIDEVGYGLRIHDGCMVF